MRRFNFWLSTRGLETPQMCSHLRNGKRWFEVIIYQILIIYCIIYQIFYQNVYNQKSLFHNYSLAVKRSTLWYHGSWCLPSGQLMVQSIGDVARLVVKKHETSHRTEPPNPDWWDRRTTKVDPEDLRK